MLAYWRHVEAYYCKNGQPTSEVDTIRQALRPVKALYGRSDAVEFGPLRLKAVRQRMIDQGWCRKHINKQLNRIKRMFKWGVGEEMIPSSVYEALRTVEALRKGRTHVREKEPVQPVPAPLIDPIRPFVSAQVEAMMDLQMLTGMRPGEVCILRGCDLNMADPVWVFHPESHKTEHFEQNREIYLGPKAQAIIKRFLKIDLQAYLFSPKDAEEARNSKRRANRQSRLTPSQKNRVRKRDRHRPWRDRYDVASYRRAIKRACSKAFPLPVHLAPRLLENRKREKTDAWRERMGPDGLEQVRRWWQEHSWCPNQLRHNAATMIRKQFGVEMARIILGHATAFTTEIYAERDRQHALHVMSIVG